MQFVYGMNIVKFGLSVVLDCVESMAYCSLRTANSLWTADAISIIITSHNLRYRAELSRWLYVALLAPT